ncbi:MAG: sugar transferase [Chloroflexi bacterium]|nr:sugar transferase [Chloroflexota bacterium]
MSWLVLERRGVKLYKPYYRTIKRFFEISLCLLLTPVFAVLGIITAICIRLDSPGPIFFVQERVGKGGRLFKMIKFRTMYHDLDRASHQDFMKAFVNGTAQEHDEHKVFKPFSSQDVTPVGRILRKTSLDELPQFINILRGEMSLIGPRPNVIWEVEEYRGWHQERLEVLPGVTGLAQVSGRSGLTFDRIVEYDIEYVEQQSIILDLKIVWWTLASILFGNGAQ